MASETEILNFIELSGELAGRLIDENNQLTKSAADQDAANKQLTEQTVEHLVKIGVVHDTPESRQLALTRLATPEGLHSALRSACTNWGHYKKASEQSQLQKSAAFEPGEASAPAARGGQAGTGRSVSDLVKMAKDGKPPFYGGQKTAELRSSDAALAERLGITLKG